MCPYRSASLMSRTKAFHKLIRQSGAAPRKYMDNITHEERTAAEPREAGLHKVYVNKVEQVSPKVRDIELGTRSLKFLPGQWLDVHIPKVPQVGGFTITSTPLDAERRGNIELAIQDSPYNPPAAWFWQNYFKVLKEDLAVRVGGSFVWPPIGIDLHSVKKVIFVAGGVGINPLISILTHLHQHPMEMPTQFSFLYTTRLPQSNSPESILFLPRLRSIFSSNRSPLRKMTLYLTPTTPVAQSDTLEAWKASQQREAAKWQRARDSAGARRTEYAGVAVDDVVDTRYGRIEKGDLLDALGPVEGRGSIVAYVCGPPAMTDWAVGNLKEAEGMAEERVFCEKWW